MKYFLLFVVFLIAICGIASGSHFSGAILLALGLLMLPIKAIQDFNEMQLSKSYEQAKIKNANLTEEQYRRSAKIANISICVILSLFIISQFGNNSNPPINDTPTQTNTVKYTDAQIKSANELIEGLKGTAGLIKKFEESKTSLGYWDIAIDENVWASTSYENKQILTVACKVYGTTHSKNQFKGCIGRGYYNGLVYFTDDSILSKPEKY